MNHVSAPLEIDVYEEPAFVAAPVTVVHSTPALSMYVPSKWFSTANGIP